MRADDQSPRPDIDSFLSHLVEALRLLAADFETQVAALPNFVHIPDEVALIFGDEFLLANQILRAERITREQYAKLKELDDFIDRMSGQEHAELWTLDAMRDRLEWREIRSMAGEVLNLLGVPGRRPKLNWIAYVPSRVADDPLKGIEFDDKNP